VKIDEQVLTFLFHHINNVEQLNDQQKSELLNGLPRTGPIFRPTLTCPIIFIRIRPVRKLADSEFVPS
jgi:hypothetical protein